MRNWVYVTAILGTVGIVARIAIRQRSFSLPGPLCEAHHGLETDCFVCHSRDRTVAVRKCSQCHPDSRNGKPIRIEGIARHHLYGDLNCLECHTEHRGPQGPVTRSEHTFDKTDCGVCHRRHVGQRTAYRLKGATHPTETVHADHGKWRDDCFACHLEGGGLSSHRCVNCHEPDTKEKVKFAGFARHHTYTDLECLDCHSEHNGRAASLLRPGKSFKAIGCRACHERHVGADHAYALTAERHPEGQLSASHQRWAGDCAACHEPNTGQRRCVVCHDAASGEPVTFTGFAAHHVRAGLPCAQCHVEHRGRAEGATTRFGVAFAKLDCATCHAKETVEPMDIARLPKDIRGTATRFHHAKHPPREVSCLECHPMQEGQPHVLAGSFRRSCADCHHRPEKARQCSQCHGEVADYFAGRLNGRLVGRGTHGKSGEVKCRDCHQYEGAERRFRPPASTCDSCHAKSYTGLFLRAKEGWDAWRAALESGAFEAPDVREIRFVARNWYHNDVHAESVRKKRQVDGNR